MNSFVPVHQIAATLGKDKCLLLPIFHAFFGKDDTSFNYGLGKNKLWKALSYVDVSPFQTFAESPELEQTIPEELAASSQAVVVKAYGGNESDTLAGLRTQRFLAGNSGLLLSLPPTEDALT